MKIAHVSWLKRHEDKKVNHGGVEKFAYYLGKVFPEMELFSWADFPVAPKGYVPDYAKAKLLNDYLIKSGQLTKDHVVVTDGYWGNGLQGKVARLISVCHGSYIGQAVAQERNPWGDVDVGSQALKQEEFWKSDVEIVCVSNNAYFELCKFSNITPNNIIENAVDLDIYTPNMNRRTQARYVVHVSNSQRKGLDIVRQMGNIPYLDVVGSFEDEAEAWNMSTVFFNPTRYEGNSYALLEAMACDVVPVTYMTGFATELPGSAAIVTDDYHVENFRNLLENITGEYHPREFLQDRVPFTKFVKEWTKYVTG